MLMLTRETIEKERRCMRLEGASSDAFAALDMALALLDVADLVPGEGDVVERVQDLIARVPTGILDPEEVRRVLGKVDEALGEIGFKDACKAAAEAIRADKLIARLRAERDSARSNGYALEEQLRRAEAERESMRRQWYDLRRMQDRQVTFDSVSMELAEETERRRRAEAERDEANRTVDASAVDLLKEIDRADTFRAKLAALTDAADSYERGDADVTVILAAIAEARKT